MSGSIREKQTKHGTVYELTLELGSDPITGKRIRKHKTFKGTRRQAEKELNRLLYEIEHGASLANSSGVSLSVWMEQWLDLYCIDLEATTKAGYSKAIETQLIPYLGDYPLKMLNNTYVQGWIKAMINDGYAPKTIKNVFLNLKAAMDKAVELKMLTANPCTGTKLPKIPKYEPRIYDWDEIENMLSCARGTDMYFPLLLEVTTGLRRGELLAVTWDDVDFETGIMHIHRNRVVADHEVIVKAPKSRAGIRDIALGEQLLDILQGEYLRYQADRQEFGSNFHDSRLLVRKEDGTPYHPHAWTKKWKRFQKANGLEENRFHDLRHSNTTALVESGVDLKTIQQRLGHSDISTTMNIYAHATKKSNREAAAKMDNAVFGRLAE